MKSRLETPRKIERSGLGEAYAYAEAASGLALLAVGLEGCDSCAKLAADLADLPDAEKFAAIGYATIDPDVGLDVQAARALRIQEYPTLYAFVDGRAVGGWRGYDHRIRKSNRLAALVELIDGLQVRFPSGSAKP